MSEDFGIRFGYSDHPLELGEMELPETLQNGLWDSIVLHFFDIIFGDSWSGRPVFSENFRNNCEILWFGFFKKTLDSIPENPRDALAQIRHRFFDANTVDFYRFIEFAVGRLNFDGGSSSKKKFEGLCNRVLERENAAFRISMGVFVKVTDTEEISEITSAMSENASTPVREHIKRAAQLYSNQNPDFRNSIKESISAVEAAVSYVLERKTNNIAKPLRKVADHFGIHSSLYEGFEKIYAWTSDDAGIRHRLMDKDTVQQEDARYMLITCSAFANYLVGLKVKHDSKTG